jgi:hypothetical protein
VEHDDYIGPYIQGGFVAAFLGDTVASIFPVYDEGEVETADHLYGTVF